VSQTQPAAISSSSSALEMKPSESEVECGPISPQLTMARSSV